MTRKQTYKEKAVRKNVFKLKANQEALARLKQKQAEDKLIEQILNLQTD